MVQKLLVALVGFVGSAAFGGEGRICVGDVPEKPMVSVGEDGTETPVFPGPNEFQIAVDDLPAVTALHAGSVSIEKLDLAKKHFVVIRKNGKPHASFRFKFSDKKTDDVCLWFNPMYETWSLWPMSLRRGKCDCPVADAK